MKIVLPVFFVFVLFFPTGVFACACCADAGFYSISAKKPGNVELEELRKIRFAAVADVFANAGFPDNVKGINPIGESYSLSGSMQNKIWKFDFKDGAGKTGTLNLLKPLSMVDFAVDTRDGKDGGANSPLLYKEWRFKYRVQSASGIFQKGFAPGSEFFLVLQGRGNACTQAGDFTDWRLEITGKKAAYAFFGKLDSGKNAAR